VVSGGFPCQDISSAGKGAGVTGERSGLWAEMARIIREVGPRFVFVENSPLLVSRGLGVVLGDLAAMGYDAQWVCSELLTPVRPTSASGSGSWPTPRACSAMAATITPESAWAPGRFPNLETVVGRRMWPTPMAHDGKDCGSSPSQAGRNSPTLPVAAGGKLNPTWVEWLMGWPIGWTDLQPLETVKFQQWRASHGVALEDLDMWDSYLERETA